MNVKILFEISAFLLATIQPFSSKPSSPHVENPIDSPPNLKGGSESLEKAETVQPLPNENDSFETVRRKHRVYIDKSPVLEKLLDGEGRAFYFTRPRKFGKTMFLRMVQKFFLGEAELFKNLAIHERGNVKDIIADDDERRSKKWLKYPVIYLDFSSPNYSTPTVEDFRRTFQNELKFTAISYDVRDIRNVKMSTLIRELNRKFNLPVIILIDDFDAPIEHALNFHNIELAKGIHWTLLDMFSVIKDARQYDEVEVVFVSGISRFSMYSKYSGANNFVDLTDTEEFATALGFTAKEINTYFKPHIQKFAKSKNTTNEKIMKELLEWYDGYRFSSKEETPVLSPTSTIECLRNQRFDNFWCATGCVQQVIDGFIKKKLGINHFENLEVKRYHLFDMYEAEHEEPPFYIYMLCVGYLTIKKYNEERDTCVLGYPNREIKDFLSNRLSTYIKSENKSIFELPEWSERLRNAMQNQNISVIMDTLKRYGFPILYSGRKHSVVLDWGVTRRLHLIFDAALIKYKPDTQIVMENSTNISVIKTLDLPINYVMQIECQEDVSKAIHELVSYIRNRSDSFKNTIDNENEVNLISIGFKDRELENWICLPYGHGKLKLDQVQASSPDLIDSVNKLNQI